MTSEVNVQGSDKADIVDVLPYGGASWTARLQCHRMRGWLYAMQSAKVRPYAYGPS